MVGKIFITRTGYDPEIGKHVKDPYLGPSPTMGACRPDIRSRLVVGDHIFVISGKVPGAMQFVMGGFEIDTKLPAAEAFRQFPQHRLRRRSDGQLAGNIIVDEAGRQHELDDHRNFDSRVKDYVIGRNLIALTTPQEIARGRSETLAVLRDVLKKGGESPIEIVGRFGATLTETQVVELRRWLDRIRRGAN